MFEFVKTFFESVELARRLRATARTYAYRPDEMQAAMLAVLLKDRTERELNQRRDRADGFDAVTA